MTELGAKSDATRLSSFNDVGASRSVNSGSDLGLGANSLSLAPKEFFAVLCVLGETLSSSEVLIAVQCANPRDDLKTCHEA